MFKVTDKQLVSYNSCTLKHYYKYLEGVSSGAIDNIQLRLLAIQQTLYWMYDNIAARRKSSLGLEEIFRKLDDRFKALASNYNVDLSTAGLDVAEARIQVKKHFDRLSGAHCIVGTQIPYTKVISRKGLDIEVSGVVDLVDSYKDKQDVTVICGTYFSFNRSPYIPGEKDFCIEAALLRLGLSKIRQDAVISGRSLMPTKEALNTITESKLYMLYNDTTTSSKIDLCDMSHIDNWIWNMAVAIKANLYYPQPSASKCSTCEYYIGCRPYKDKTLAIPSGTLENI